MRAPTTAEPTGVRRRSLSLTARTFIITGVVALAVTLSTLVIVAVSNRRSANDTVRRGLEQSADLVAQFLVARERTLVGGARVFVQGPYFRTLVAARRRDDVLDQALEAADQIGADWVFITDENGVLIAKSDETGVTGVPMGQVPLIAGALRGQVNTGFGASGDTMVFQAVAVPISAKLGAPAGVLVAARVIDSLFLHDVKAATASDLLFYARDEKDAVMRQHPPLPRQRRRSPRSSTREPPRMRRPSSPQRSTMWSTSLAVRRSALRAAMSLVVFSSCARAMARGVTRPARALAASVAGAAGATDVGSMRGSQSGVVIEVRQLANAFESLVTDLRDKEALIAAARMPAVAHDAEGDPTAASDRGRSARTVGARGIAARAPLARQISRPGLVLDPGAVLANRYLIQAEVGRGGLGIVYRALDRVLGEVIGIKVLRPELVMPNASAFEQLKSELRITRRLSHRHIVRTYDIGETDAAPFLTMEFVEGASLATIIQARGALSPAAVLAVAKQLTGALAVAHDRDIIHGDLKPQNLLVDANGLLKVSDFGVARLVRDSRVSRRDVGEGANGLNSGGARIKGALLGTPEYMAPEQLIGEPSSMHTDIYAAGVVLQECLTGTTPYGADTPVAFVARKLGAPEKRDTSVSARGTMAHVEPDIAAIVDQMTSAQPEARPSSARALLSRFAALA
jgi:hypothetical protein